MAQSERLKIILTGDLSRAVAWEAERRGVSAQEFISGLVSRASADILAQWHDDRQSPAVSSIRPLKQEILAVRSVVVKAYGPHRRPAAARRARP